MAAVMMLQSLLSISEFYHQIWLSAGLNPETPFGSFDSFGLLIVSSPLRLAKAFPNVLVSYRLIGELPHTGVNWLGSGLKLILRSLDSLGEKYALEISALSFLCKKSSRLFLVCGRFANSSFGWWAGFLRRIRCQFGSLKMSLHFLVGRLSG